MFGIIQSTLENLFVIYLTVNIHSIFPLETLVAVCTVNICAVRPVLGHKQMRLDYEQKRLDDEQERWNDEQERLDDKQERLDDEQERLDDEQERLDDGMPEYRFYFILTIMSYVAKFL